jgi:hypothetical protein
VGGPWPLDGTRGPKIRRLRQVGSGRIERSTGGGEPRGGDAAESMDGQRTGGVVFTRRRRGEGFGFSGEGSTASERSTGGPSDGDIGRAEHAPGNSPGMAEELHAERGGIFGSRHGYGKTSNARSATIKAKEGAGKANDSLPCVRRGENQPGAIQEPRHLSSTRCALTPRGVTLA